MRTLTFFSGLTPNQDGGVHYFLDFQNKYAFRERFNSYETLVLYDDNYRINGNVLKIRYDNTNSEEYYKRLTYIEVYDASSITGERKYYYIRKVTIQSDNVIFTLELDLWQTYINFCDLDLTTITRTNKKMGEGIYLPIETTHGRLLDTNVDGRQYGLINDNEVSILFLLQYNVVQQTTGLGEEVITKTNLFAINLHEIKEHLDETEQARPYSSLQLAIDYVSSVYGIRGSIFNSTLDARVLKAWIVDNNYIDTDIYDGATYQVYLRGRSTYYNSTTEIEVEALRVRPSIMFKTVSVENNPNHSYMLGTFNNGLELVRYAKPTLEANYYFIVSQEDFKVIVQQGNNQKDITTAFSVALTTNAETTTALRALAMGIKQLTGFIDKGINSFKKEGGLGVLTTGLNALADSVPLKPNLQNAVGNGDGFNTFYYDQSTEEAKGYLRTPYIVTYTQSIYDERQRLLREGAVFKSIYTPPLYSNLLYELLNTDYLVEIDESEIELYPTFIACETNVSGVPLEARDYIKNKLSVGIYLSN